MPTLNTKFSDNNLKTFYGNLLTHYQQCETRKLDVNATYAEMYQAVYYAIESQHGSFYNLEPLEKRKVYDSFDAIFKALPIFTGMPAANAKAFKPDYAELRTRVVIINHNYHGYRYNNDFLVDWMILSSMTNNCHHHHYSSSPFGGAIHHHGGSVNTHSKDDKSDGMAQLIAALVVIALAAFAVVLATIALYYMLNQFLEGVERFWYSEGWLKAALMMATSAAFGAVSTVLTMTFLAGPLISLAMLAGFNPVAIVVLGAVCLTAMGAGLGCYAMSLLYNKIDAPKNQDSMDAADPLRFRLTASEEDNLVKKGLDRIKVRCAMVALRAEMSKELKSETASPSFLSRHFGDGRRVQALLDQVRQLRQGKLPLSEDDNSPTLKVGNLTFNCSAAPQPPSYYASSQSFHQPAHAARQPDASSVAAALQTGEVEGSTTNVHPLPVGETPHASAPPAYASMG